MISACCVAPCRIPLNLRGSFNCVNQRSGTSLTQWPEVKEERMLPSRARSGQRD